MTGDAPRQIPARRGFSVSYNGRTLLSTIDPIGQAERLADSVALRDRTLYLCPSPLLGYGLERLLARMADEAPQSALLCIEADEQLLRLASESFSGTLQANENVKLSGAVDAVALYAFVRRVWGRGRRFRRVETLRFSGGWQLFPDLYRSCEEVLSSEIALDWGNALTLSKLGRLYMRNALRNLALIPRYPSLSTLKESAFSFGNTPALVLGAGPSLDELLDGLAAHFGAGLDKDKRPFRIICVDTCLQILKARNIEPDLAVVLESQHWNLSDFIGLGDWKPCAALDLSALPASARLPGLCGFLFFTPWTEIRLFSRLKQAGLLPQAFPPLGSVGLSATAIALSLTSGPVLVGGMDFSYTVDASHARSSPAHRARLNRHNRLHSLLNVAALEAPSFTALSKLGTQVQSSPVMRNYRDLFEREFSAVGRVFDTRSNGLPLGVKTLSWNVFLETLESGSRVQNGQGYPLDMEGKLAEDLAEKLAAFIADEKERLTELKTLLSGETPDPDHDPERQAFPLEKLETLIDECDYLWAHFPDYAGTGGYRPQTKELAAGTPTAISFLKRLRAEIDPAQQAFSYYCQV